MGFGREIEQLQSFAGEAVQPRCVCATQDAAAVAAQLAHAEVVDMDVKNVRRAGRRWLCLLLNRNVVNVHRLTSFGAGSHSPLCAARATNRDRASRRHHTEVRSISRVERLL